MSRIHRAALAMILVVSLILASPVAAQDSMVWWVITPLTTTYHDETSCQSTGRVGHQEFGQSGVTRLRAKFELRTQYDPGYLPYVPASTGWLYADAFPDDAANYWTWWSYWFRYAQNKEYWIRGILIGERPSLWQADLKLHAHLGDAICYTQVQAEY